ncbi:CocE/NonD family hydrolase C-terminal non-catalytic domain-containing protein [Streptomyces thinghirensis]
MPELLTPGEVYEVEVTAPDTANRLVAGHRVRLDVSSSNFPRFDVNTNTDEPEAAARRTAVAANTVHMDAEHPPTCECGWKEERTHSRSRTARRCAHACVPARPTGPARTATRSASSRNRRSTRLLHGPLSGMAPAGQYCSGATCHRL